MREPFDIPPSSIIMKIWMYSYSTRYTIVRFSLSSLPKTNRKLLYPTIDWELIYRLPIPVWEALCLLFSSILKGHGRAMSKKTHSNVPSAFSLKIMSISICPLLPHVFEQLYQHPHNSLISQFLFYRVPHQVQSILENNRQIHRKTLTINKSTTQVKPKK